MASDESSISALAEHATAAQKQAIEFWESQINEEDGSFEFVFGDPTSTPYAIRLNVYFDDDGESKFDIGYEAVDKSFFAVEDSFEAQEKLTLQGLIEDALPLLDDAVYKFGEAIYDSLSTFEDHPSFYDPLIAEYHRLKELERVARKEKIDKIRHKETLFKLAAAAESSSFSLNKSKEEKALRRRIIEHYKTYTFKKTKAQITKLLKSGHTWSEERQTFIPPTSIITAAETNHLLSSARNAVEIWKQVYDKFGDTDVASSRTRLATVAASMPTIHVEHIGQVTPPWTESEEAFFTYLELVAASSQRLFQFGNAGLTRLPHCVSVLKEVFEFNVPDNKILLIPSELVSLPNLRRLFLANNKIKMIPDVSGCVNLEVLDIRQNAISSVPAGIGACQKLNVFDAEKNKIKEFGDLVQCPKLEFINFNRNLIKIVPGELALLENLQYMQVKHNPIVNLPPHIYIQGMAAIMAYINDQTQIDSNLQTSSIRSDFLNLITTSSPLTDFVLIATKDAPEVTVSLPYTDRKELDNVDTSKVLALLLTNNAMETPHPSSIKVHSLFLISRLPILRERVLEALKTEKAVLSLSVTPKELNTLLRFIYSDSYDKPIPPSQETAVALAKQSPKSLNTHEIETLRNSLVQIWRTELMDTVALGKEYQLRYLATLALKAMGYIETEASPFAASTFADDLETLLPISTVQQDMIVPELNMEDAMRHITEGFSELSMLGSQMEPAMLPTFANYSHAPANATTAVTTDCTYGVKSAAWAPNDIAFRIVNEPGAPLIGAHKIILCARSPYLHIMLTGGLIESTQSIIEMADISYDTLKAIVEFCYRDDVTDIHGEMIMELLMKARLFGMDRLLSYIESIVGYSIDITNVTGIMSVAYMYSLPRLAKACKFFVVSNWSKVTADPSWQDLDEKIRSRLIGVAIKWGIIEDPNAKAVSEAEEDEEVEIEMMPVEPSMPLETEETLVEA